MTKNIQKHLIQVLTTQPQQQSQLQIVNKSIRSQINNNSSINNNGDKVNISGNQINQYLDTVDDSLDPYLIFVWVYLKKN